MDFLYGAMVVISCAIPDVATFYGCAKQGKVIGVMDDKYLVVYDGCTYNKVIPFAGYDRGWFQPRCLSKVEEGKK